MSNTRIEREAKKYGRYKKFEATAYLGYQAGAVAEHTRAAPVVKALEFALAVIESECDDKNLVVEIKQIIDTYKADRIE